MTSPNTAEVSAEHAIWPQDPQFDLALAGGVTTMHILPGSANLFGGRGVTVKNVPARTADAMKFPGAPYGLKMACGENPKRVYGGRNSSPRPAWATLPATASAWHCGNRVPRQLSSGGATGSDPAKRPDRNLQMETLAGVLNGEILDPESLLPRRRDGDDDRHRAGSSATRFRRSITRSKPTRSATCWSPTASAPACGPTGGGSSSRRSTASARTSRSSMRRKAAPSSTPTSANGIQRLNQEAAKAMRAGREAGITIGPRGRGQMAVDQSREGARHRQDDGFTRSRGGSRCGHLVGGSVQRLRPHRARCSWTGSPLRPERSAKQPLRDFTAGTAQAGEVR